MVEKLNGMRRNIGLGRTSQRGKRRKIRELRRRRGIKGRKIRLTYQSRLGTFRHSLLPFL